MFKPVIESTSVGPLGVVERYVEQATLVHEFGHAVGDRPESERWTVQYAGSKMTYDDQWSSPGLASRRQADSVTILRVAVSDHAAVAATYTLE